MSSSIRMQFAQKVAQSILRNKILGQGTVLVALSGGADSVALLRVLIELGVDCAAAHCNFRLRGEESDRDEQFVTNLCKVLNIKLHTTAFDTKDYARQRGISIEMAARDLRYGYFNTLVANCRYSCVAVAHHRDDNIETILLNLVRGTGIKGLTGMAYKRDKIIRPLLDFSREEILAYLHEIKQDYVTDSSNLVADVKRNVVRLKLMPILRELNPSVSETIARSARHMQEVCEFIEETMADIDWHQREDGSYTIDKSEIKSHLILFKLLCDKGFTPTQTDEIWNGLNGPSGAVYTSKSHKLLRDRDCLILMPVNAPIENATITTRIADVSEFATIPRRRDIACLDADKVGENFTVRPVRNGDRFIPLGMKGSKLVSDFLTDIKADRFRKQSQKVLTNGTDIVWLVGQRIDDRYKVVENETQRILICEINHNNDN